MRRICSDFLPSTELGLCLVSSILSSGWLSTRRQAHPQRAVWSSGTGSESLLPTTGVLCVRYFPPELPCPPLSGDVPSLGLLKAASPFSPDDSVATLLDIGWKRGEDP